MIHCHDVTKLNDVARGQYISGALAAVLWPFFAGYRVFPAAVPKFEGDWEIYRNSANSE
jgi:hypothetical protein